MILQTASPPQKAGSVSVHAISGISVNMAVRMSANDKWTRKKFIRVSWNKLSFYSLHKGIYKTLYSVYSYLVLTYRILAKTWETIQTLKTIQTRDIIRTWEIFQNWDITQLGRSSKLWRSSKLMRSHNHLRPSSKTLTKFMREMFDFYTYTHSCQWFTR